MNVDAQCHASRTCTILRIKRKRTEEPLDALVIESSVRRKKSRGSIGVFQFAQTVEQDAWEDEKRRKDIQTEISRIACETVAKEQSKPSTALPPPSPTISRTKDEPTRRYKIIPDLETSKQLTCPPKSLASKDSSPEHVNDYKMYDATLSPDPTPDSVDSDMENFMPMLYAYLKLHQVSPPPSPPRSPIPAPPALSTSTVKDDDYVWDVFYHRPTTLSEWNEAANVGTLTGLPPSITDPYDSASDSEEEDGADEDSNAEEYYKNEYPDEESSVSGSSDDFHEHSDHDDLMQYQDDGDDHDWR